MGKARIKATWSDTEPVLSLETTKRVQQLGDDDWNVKFIIKKKKNYSLVMKNQVLACATYGNFSSFIYLFLFFPPKYLFTDRKIIILLLLN